MMSEQFNLIEYLTVQRNKGIIVWLLNIGAEKYWNPVNTGIIDRNEDKIVNRVEEMNLLICREQDVLILRQQPDEAYLAMLRQWGFSIPNIWIPEQTDAVSPISELIMRDEKLQQKLEALSKDHTDVYFVPYAITYVEEQIAEKCGLQLISASSKVNALVNDKIFNRQIAEQLELDVCQGKVCASIEEIRQEYDRLVKQAPFFEKVIIKEPHGASGKGLYIIDSEEKLTPLLSRLVRFSRNNPEMKWLVEGWYNKKADINYQIYISPLGAVNVFSIKEQILRDTVYIGSKMPAELDTTTVAAYQDFGQRIGKYLFDIGYTGVAGIDSIITADNKIIPIIEINGRFTLSTYISFIEHIIGKRKIFSRYFKMVSNTPFNYNDLCTAIGNDGLLYDVNTGEGVMVYTSGTLSFSQDEQNSLYIGRVFTLIISNDWQTVESLILRFENYITGLNSPNMLKI